MEKLQAKNYRSIIETLLIVLLFLGLLYALFDVLKVFLGIFTFALIFAVAFAQSFEKLVRLLKGRRNLGAVIYTILLTAVIVQPFMILISTLSHHLKDISHFITEVRTNGLPPLSPSLSKLPVAGEYISQFYTQLQQQPKETLAQHEEQIKNILHGIITKGAGIFGATTEIILGIIISAFLLSGREKIFAPFYNALKHILGKEDTDSLLKTSEMAVKGVSIGIMGTAFIAAAVAWIGLFIAGIPFSLGLAAIVFFLVIIQVGPLPIWIPIVIWLFIQGHTGWGIFMIIYGVILLAIDSVIKPLLISKSGKLPFLVLFLGVIGGMVAWGFTGMFKGAIIVAVCYTVFINWLERKEENLNPVAAIDTQD